MSNISGTRSATATRNATIAKPISEVTAPTAPPTLAEVQAQLAITTRELRETKARNTTLQAAMAALEERLEGPLELAEPGDLKASYGPEQLSMEFRHVDLVGRVLLLQDALTTARTEWVRMNTEIKSLTATTA